MIQTLLIVDDEPNIRLSLQESLATDKLTIVTAPNAKVGIEMVKLHRPDAVLLDVRLPDISGLDAYDRIREIDSRIPVIMMTAFSKTDTAIDAMRRGAFDYLIKPVDFRQLQASLSKALEMSRLSHVPARLTEGEEDVPLDADRIVGFAPAMQEVYKTIGRVASQDATVLILGESGTGKELVARAIYHYSSRNQKPFLAINCAALSETLLESELFGHERGAFTGADQRRIGKFEQVNGGTIFLDEIGDMSPATQAKALRLLQQQQFERVGGNVTIQTDVRIITATNCDLAQLVEEGKFRRDLFYRLNGFTIKLPRLQDRREDIPVLAEHFLKRFNRELKKRIRAITLEALELLQRHSWPGNIRELESAVRYAMVRTTGEIITADSLPDVCRVRATPAAGSTFILESGVKDGATEIGMPLSPGNPLPTNASSSSNGKVSQVEPASANAAGVHGPNHNSGDVPLDLAALTRNLLADESTNVYREVGNKVDRIVLEMVMRYAEGNQQLAAEYLGISRMTLRTKLRALGMLSERSAN
ncbi:MAG: sigma-54 dependent transcriptional regulator [Planctomycetia bacterium]|nr:sigma-54 dependent transcriptional regulator [Planctomycetia bacterium]